MLSIHTSIFRFVTKRLPSRSPAFVYVAMGDSAAEGVGASKLERSYPSIIHSFLKKRHKKISYHNFAKKHSPVSWVMRDQLDKTVRINPDLITISVGANDIRVRNVPWKFKKELQMLIRELKEKTNATIIINSIPDFSHVKSIPFFLQPVAEFTIKRYNTTIEQVAKEEEIVFVDLFHQTGIFAKAYPEAVGDDGFHPSDFGYALWASSILHVLSGLRLAKTAN